VSGDGPLVRVVVAWSGFVSVSGAEDVGMDAKTKEVSVRTKDRSDVTEMVALVAGVGVAVAVSFEMGAVLL